MKVKWLVLSWLLCGAVSAAGEVASVTVVPSARDCVCLEVGPDRVYGGLANGGVVVLDLTTPTETARWTTADGLSGQRVTDLAWTGRFLWVATADGGLTRIDPRDGKPAFRQVVNIADLNTTAVTGLLRGTTEWVWYGTDGAGLGVVVDGLPGAITTHDVDDGLVSDVIRCLAMRGDDLVVGTDNGVSILVDNLLQDWSGALAGQDIHDLLAAGDTVWAATDGGVYRRLPDGDWEPVGSLGRLALRLALAGGALVCLDDAGDIRKWDGVSWHWTSPPLPGAVALAGGEWIRVAGGHFVSTDNYKARRAWMATAGDTWQIWESADLTFVNAGCAAVSPEGALWVGSRDAAGVAWNDGDGWSQLTEVATDSTDGLFNDDGPILGISLAPDGAVWFCQFQRGGLVRLDPVTGATLHLDRDNSGLVDNRVVDVMVHPDGVVLAGSDRHGVSVLADPARPTDTDAWLVLDTDAGALGGGTITGMAVLRRDRILFAVEGVGIAVWDPNGLAAGPDDPLTWLDTGDDVWARLETTPPGSFFDPAATRRLAVADDGSFWSAGSGGVAHLRITSFGGGRVEVAVLAEYHAKQDPHLPGLMQESVEDVAVAPDGAAWICHDRGIECIREESGGVTITPYTSVGDYFRSGLGVFYSPTIIAGLPPGKYVRLAVGAGGRYVLVAGENGTVLLTITGGEGTGGDPLASARIYPNPYRPGEHAGLVVTGVDAPVSWIPTAVTGGVAVEIYNLEGQLVYREEHAEPDEPFWDGRNLVGQPAAAGPYLVRLRLGGAATVQAITLVR